MIALGLDIGSVAAKGVLLDGERLFTCLSPTGWDPRSAGEALVAALLAEAGKCREEARVIVTGYGRVSFQGADRVVTEISCHAKGVAKLLPGTDTIVDIGGQDSKVIRISQSGKVIDFAMNDKCAAGTGRFLQVTAAALGLAVDELDNAEDRALEVEISSMCAVFAESEIIGLLASGVSKGGIIAGLHRSIGKRVATMARSLGVGGQIAFTGGVALNRGIQRALSEELGQPVQITEYCQFVGALGAAMLARTC
ncbi:MAG: 2-hydroxyglutaryl-CoA dehydratase [Clostridium sp.]|nr:2-hydroxyglutaryl-CoA dehydratase [Clostridium sp.]